VLRFFRVLNTADLSQREPVTHSSIISAQSTITELQLFDLHLKATSPSFHMEFDSLSITCIFSQRSLSISTFINSSIITIIRSVSRSTANALETSSL
jgi:hypothetical protein